MITTSGTISELATALSLAQGEMDDAELDGYNPHFKSKFSTLKAIRKACRGVLAKHGLAIIQAPTVAENGEPAFETMITHKSGQWITSHVPLFIDKQTMQGLGAAISYARRYTQGPMLGIVNEEDDDGNASSQQHASPKKVPNMNPPASIFDYVIPFGKELRGKRLEQVPIADLRKAVTWLREEQKKGTPLTTAHQEFIENVLQLQTMS